MSATVIAFLILVGLLILSVVFILIQHKNNKLLKEKLDKKNELYNGLVKEFELLKETDKIKEENQKEADNKINQMLTGDSVANAINELSKHNNL